MSEPRDILEALFVGDDVPDAEVLQAMHAGQTDASVRALFDELALVDRELGGDFEARAGDLCFFTALDTMLAEEAEAELQDNVVSLESRRSRGAVWLAAAAVVAIGFAGVLLQERDPVDTQFQPRSATTLKPHDYAMPAVEVFCVQRDEGHVEFVGNEQSELATVHCAIDEEIKLAVRNPDLRLRYAAFVGIGADDSLYWYGPSPAAPQALAIPSERTLTPIGETIRLDVNHDPGTVRVIGVFAERPLDFADVEKWTAANTARLRDGNLSLEQGVVVRHTFEVTQ